MFRSHGLWPQKTPQETAATLRQQVEDGKAVAEVLKMPGWLVIQKRSDADIRKRTEDLCNLEPLAFQSAHGLQMKGEVCGMKDVINLVFDVMKEGRAAELKLDAIADESQRNGTVKPPVATRP